MATYYSSHNAAGGGAGTIIDPYTLQELLDNTDAGDLGLVMATGTYTPAATIDVDNASAVTDENPPIIRGANADGTDDGTVATISGSGFGANTDLFNCNVASLNIKFEGLRMTAATRYNVVFQDTINTGNIVFDRCRIDTATSHGVYENEGTAQFNAYFINCEIDSNGGCGISNYGQSRGALKMINCKVHDNVSDGVQYTGGTTGKNYVIDSMLYDNGANGINVSNDDFGSMIKNCVFFNNTDNGINFADTANTGMMTVVNNIFRSNGGYAIDTNGGTLRQFAYINYNCSHNNTSGHIDINGGVLPGTGNVTSDPKFTSEADGAEDFTLQATSPCINIGFGYDG